MAFFEDLGKKITKAGSSAVDFTKQKTEMVSLHNKIDDKNKVLIKVYKQFGEIYISKYSSEAPEDLLIYIEEATNLKKEIEELERHLLTVKGFVRCSKCGNDIKIGDAFCSKCGEPAPKEEESKTTSCGETCSVDESNNKEEKN